MKNVSRRNFLKSSIACAAGAAGAIAASNLLAVSQAPHMKFPVTPRERIGVTTWPFRMYIDSSTNPWRDPKLPGIALEDFPAMIATKFGLYNVELLARHFPSTDEAYLQELRAAVENAGSQIIDIPISGTASFYDPFAVKRQEAIDFGRKWIDIAAAVGSPSVRLHIEGVQGIAPDADRTAESLKQVAAYGAQRNIMVTLENDDLVTEDAFFIVRVIDNVQNPYLRALPDFANSMLSGNSEFNYDALTLMFRHAYNIAHMKNSEVGGHGSKLYTVDVGRIFKIAEAAGYRGYYSLEWEGRGGAYEGTSQLLAETLKHLS
ncbi:MAG TPA: sugar phosphate isomerase/epimerase family protein [Terriglobia bacterium]|nr:sugar phosphate isomerase/epimerase family protein [Terriglobia bacterium]